MQTLSDRMEIHEKEEESALEYPRLRKRIQSIFIDSFLIILTMTFATYVLDNVGERNTWMNGVIFTALAFVYEPVCMAFGCTLGNYVMKIRVRDAYNYTLKINLLRSYLRFITKIMLGWLSFITISFTPEKRAVHDLISGTVMVEV